MAVITTTHDANGKSIIRQAEAPKDIPVSERSVTVLYRADISNGLIDMNGEADLKNLKDTQELKPASFYEQPIVLRARVPPRTGGDKDMHRTLSVALILIESGEIEHYLDSGEKVVLKKGDFLIQRGTKHYWRNASETEPVQMLTFSMPTKPIEGAAA